MTSIPDTGSPGEARVTLIEAEPGRHLASALDALAADLANEALHVTCDFERKGLWSGLDQLVEHCVEDCQRLAPEAVESRLPAISTVLPAFRLQALPRLGLTEQAPAPERVRNYAADRIYRTLHDLVDLVVAWRQAVGTTPWVLVCEGLDGAGQLVRRFFSELVRRGGPATGLRLLVSVSPGHLEEVESLFPPPTIAAKRSLELEPEGADLPSKTELRQRAERLEEEVGEDALKIEAHVSKLIFLWLRSDRPERAVHWQATALGLYNHQGCYEDGARYVEPVLTGLDRLVEEARPSEFWHMSRWNVVGNIYGCLNAVGRPEDAAAVVEQTIPKLPYGTEQARARYALAMSHARFLPEHNLKRAAELLEQGLEFLEKDGIREQQASIFLRSFLANGLALVRHREGRPEEAIRLCTQAQENLDRHLSPGQFRLHRSVLVYNIAQVYAAVGRADDAIRQYTAAIEMDPKYPEYFNERGAVHLARRDFALAEADFRQAIELSSPYPEVWTNLGQCLSLSGDLRGAIGAYGVALDLSPGAFLPSIGRAQAHHRLGQLEEALADYGAALTANPDHPLILSNRAAVLVDLGRPEKALEDLDAALAFDPQNQALLANRRHVLGLLEVRTG